MTVTELKNRIARVETKISKLNASIIKLEKSRDSIKSFEKKYSDYNDFAAERDKLYQDWLDDYNEKIHTAQLNLSSNQMILNKFRAMLAEAEQKENNVPVIEAFKEFFDNWKKDILEYVNDTYAQYLEANKESCNMYNKKNEYLKTMTKDEYLEKYREVEMRETRLLNCPFISERSYRGEDGFNKYLDKYLANRYLELVNKVVKITGNITDATNLSVGNDGSINGIIYGDAGKARIETIIAGGENESIIVNVKHGQRMHYRVLVHKIK